MGLINTVRSWIFDTTFPNEEFGRQVEEQDAEFDLARSAHNDLVNEQYEAAASGEQDAEAQSVTRGVDWSTVREKVAEQFDDTATAYSVFEAIVAGEARSEEAALAYLAFYSFFGNDELTAEQLSIAETALPEFLEANYLKMDKALRAMPDYDVPQLEATPQSQDEHNATIRNLRSRLREAATTFASEHPQMQSDLAMVSADLSEDWFLAAHPDLPCRLYDFGCESDSWGKVTVTDLDYANAQYAKMSDILGDTSTDVETLEASVHSAFPTIPQRLATELAIQMSEVPQAIRAHGVFLTRSVEEQEFQQDYPDLPFTDEECGFQHDSEGHNLINPERGRSVLSDVGDMLGGQIDDLKSIPEALSTAFPSIPEGLRDELSERLTVLSTSMQDYDMANAEHSLKWLSQTLRQQDRRLTDSQSSALPDWLPGAVRGALGEEGQARLEKGDHTALAPVLRNPVDRIDLTRQYLLVTAEAEHKPQLVERAHDLLGERADIAGAMSNAALKQKTLERGVDLAQDDDMSL